jgi:hypothetical protein
MQFGRIHRLILIGKRRKTWSQQRERKIKTWIATEVSDTTRTVLFCSDRKRYFRVQDEVFVREIREQSSFTGISWLGKDAIARESSRNFKNVFGLLQFCFSSTRIVKKKKKKKKRREPFKRSKQFEPVLKLTEIATRKDYSSALCSTERNNRTLSLNTCKKFSSFSLVTRHSRSQRSRRVAHFLKVIIARTLRTNDFFILFPKNW